MAHVNAEALRNDSPEIEIEDSLTAFVKRLKLDPKGRNMRTIKDQLARLRRRRCASEWCATDAP